MIDNKDFIDRLPEYERECWNFIKASRTPAGETVRALWRGIVALKARFFFDADGDMAKFTFENGRSASLCTSTRRFHRPNKTGKPLSVTIILGGFKKEYEDPENQLVPCDLAGKLDCCYFGMAEDEEEFALFYISQLVRKKPLRNRTNLVGKSKISGRSA